MGPEEQRLHDCRQDLNISSSSIKRECCVDYENTGFSRLDFDAGLWEISSLLGMNLKDYSEVNVGTFNKVFVVSTDLESSQLVLKVSPLWNNTGLDRERWCYDIVDSLNALKKPQILLYLANDNDIFPGHELLAMSFVQGHHPSVSEMLSPAVFTQIRAALDQIHSVNMSGYGWLDSSYVGKQASWDAFLSDIDNLSLVLEANVLPVRNIEELLNRLALIDFVDTGSLLFGDFNRTNLILDQETKLHFIDFQNCFSGDPLYDSGIGVFFHPELLDTFVAGFEPQGQAAALERISLYAMRHAISALGHRLTVRDEKGVAEACDRFFYLNSIIS